MDLSSTVGDGSQSGFQMGSGDYDRIRKENTAGDPVEEDFGSGSAGCSVPIRDYPLKAYAQDGEAIVGLPDEDEADSETQFVKLGNFKLPKKERAEEVTPVEAD
jgi:hypothetical protein